MRRQSLLQIRCQGRKFSTDAGDAEPLPSLSSKQDPKSKYKNKEVSKRQDDEDRRRYIHRPAMPAATDAGEGDVTRSWPMHEQYSI